MTRTDGLPPPTLTDVSFPDLLRTAAITSAPPEIAAPCDPPSPSPGHRPPASSPGEGDGPGHAPFALAVAEALARVSPAFGLTLAEHQLPPPEHEDPDGDVTGWVLLAGRGAGKTYASARWMHRKCSSRPGVRARIIAPSLADAVASCVEGPSGILEASNHTVQWKPSHPGGAQLRWPNGSVCYVVGTPTPREVDRLRALTNIDYDWFEEAAANTQLAEVEKQARLSRRRRGSKWIATTTPRPLPTIRAWKKDSKIAISSATAHSNKHADPQWLAELENMYRGTRLYAQEVEGKVLEDVEGALWQIAHLDRSRIIDLAEFYAMNVTIARAAVGVDPASGTGTTGLVAVLMSDDRHLYVVEDVSKRNLSAEQWARAAVDLAVRWNAPLIAENDQGGDMVRAVLKAADLLDEVTILPARARNIGGKGVRAEPVALLWERDDFRGHLVGTFPELEDELTTWVPDNTVETDTGDKKKITQPSPNHLDAMVWACTYLWGRASFSEVTSRWPDGVSSNDPTGENSPQRVQERLAAVRRPGAMVRWHRGVGRPRKDSKT